jgi:uncharacterized membrane protein YozB (DUF420 family)
LDFVVLTAENVILTLKVAVIAVTLLFLSSLAALARGNYRLHGRINLAFCMLTLAALFGLEVVARLVDPDLFKDHFSRTRTWDAFYVHLCFSVPSALMLPLMLYTGLRGLRGLHLALAGVFVVLWTGTFITGVFFLPHTTGP